MPTRDSLNLQADGSRDAYTGPLKAVPLRAFLDGHALKEPLPEAAAAAGPGGAGKGAAGPDGMMGEVVLHALNASNLTEIDGRHEMWLLAFYRAAGGWRDVQMLFSVQVVAALLHVCVLLLVLYCD